MKKFFMIVAVVSAMCLSSVEMNAQESKFALGAGLNYGTEIDNLGVSLLGLYTINEQWEAAPGFTFFFEKDYTKMSSLDLNAHYVFSRNGGNTFYGLAGLNVTFFKWEMPSMSDETGDYNNWEDDYDVEWGGDYNDEWGSDFDAEWGDVFSDLTTEMELKEEYIGLNIGAGGRFELSEVLSMNAEVKYILGDLDYLNVGVGLLYHF